MGVNPPLPSPERGIFAICPILCAERKTTQKFVLCLKCTPILTPTPLVFVKSGFPQIQGEMVSNLSFFLNIRFRVLRQAYH